jgi:hypothetical protein
MVTSGGPKSPELIATVAFAAIAAVGGRASINNKANKKKHKNDD